MKRFSALLLALLMTLTLAACGNGGEDTAHVGKYLCTSVMMNGVDLGSGDEWVELKNDGTANVYMGGESRTAQYTLEEGNFSLSIDGQDAGTGTLENGTLTMDFLGMTCVFQQEADQE